MNAKLRIAFVLMLGLLTFVGTLLAMGPHSQDAAHTSASRAPQTAPEPYMVKDIYSGTTGSSPSGLTAVSNTLFFVADDGTRGKELWKSDGTSDGTVLVKDIYTGSSSSSINNLAGMNGTLFFNADDGVYGLELWKSDGTTNGTVMVKDIRTGNPGSQNPSTAQFARVGNTLFFVAAEPTNGEELWKSDGTLNGTALVKDIYPGGFPLNNSTPDWLTEMNGLLFFTADDGSHGRQPWKSDGMPTATLMISNVNAASGDPPSWLTNVDGTLFFISFTGSGYALCKSDSTLTGTSVITDLGGSPPGSLTNVNGVLFLQAHEQLWKSDGTPTGTVMVKNIYPYFPINVNGTLFFAASDSSSGLELWKSDGTPEGTEMVRDINPGNGSSLPTPARFSNVNGILYFGASDGSHGAELWKSDGTFTGTVMIADINPGSGSSSPYRFALSGTTLFFVANNGSHGQELWALSVLSSNIRHVAVTGDDSNNNCLDAATPCRTVQYAVDVANEGDIIRVATGVYTDVESRRAPPSYSGPSVVAQVVYISKTLTIQGGYTTTYWSTPYPLTQPTTLDALGQGRALFIAGDVSPTIEGLHITSGNAAGLGGAPSPGGTVDSGGGVYIVSASATLSNNLVFSNTANLGGGINIVSATATFRSNWVFSNTASSGGGLFLDASAAMLDRNIVMSNTASNAGGGGYLRESAATLNDNTIISNDGGNAGGGLTLSDGSATLSGDIVMSNKARQGGGLSSGGAVVTLVNTVIADNQINYSGGYGSAINSWSSSYRLLHTTIARNTGGNGSGVYVRDWAGTGMYSTVAMTNTILVSHTVGITVTAGNTATLNGVLWYSNTTNYGGLGAITVTNALTDNPAFAVDGYHLTAGSAAINRGVDAGVSTDIDGDIRPDCVFSDLGADEFTAGLECRRIYLPIVMRQ